MSKNWIIVCVTALVVATACVFVLSACGEILPSSKTKSIDVPYGYAFDTPYASFETKGYASAQEVANEIDDFTDGKVAADMIEADVVADKCMRYIITFTAETAGSVTPKEFAKAAAKAYMSLYGGWKEFGKNGPRYRTVDGYDVLVQTDTDNNGTTATMTILVYCFQEGKVDALLEQLGDLSFEGENKDGDNGGGGNNGENNGDNQNDQLQIPYGYPINFAVSDYQKKDLSAQDFVSMVDPSAEENAATISSDMVLDGSCGYIITTKEDAQRCFSTYMQQYAGWENIANITVSNAQITEIAYYTQIDDRDLFVYGTWAADLGRKTFIIAMICLKKGTVQTILQAITENQSDNPIAIVAGYFFTTAYIDYKSETYASAQAVADEIARVSHGMVPASMVVADVKTADCMRFYITLDTTSLATDSNLNDYARKVRNAFLAQFADWNQFGDNGPRYCTIGDKDVMIDAENSATDKTATLTVAVYCFTAGKVAEVQAAVGGNEGNQNGQNGQSGTGSSGQPEGTNTSNQSGETPVPVVVYVTTYQDGAEQSTATVQCNEGDILNVTDYGSEWYYDVFWQDRAPDAVKAYEGLHLLVRNVTPTVTFTLNDIMPDKTMRPTSFEVPANCTEYYGYSFGYLVYWDAACSNAVAVDEVIPIGNEDITLYRRGETGTEYVFINIYDYARGLRISGSSVLVPLKQDKILNLSYYNEIPVDPNYVYTYADGTPFDASAHVAFTQDATLYRHLQYEYYVVTVQTADGNEICKVPFAAGSGEVSSGIAYDYGYNADELIDADCGGQLYDDGSGVLRHEPYVSRDGTATVRGVHSLKKATFNMVYNGKIVQSTTYYFHDEYLVQYGGGNYYYLDAALRNQMEGEDDFKTFKNSFTLYQEYKIY